MQSIDDIRKMLNHNLRTFDIMQDAIIKLQAAEKAIEQAVIAFDGLYAAVTATQVPPLSMAMDEEHRNAIEKANAQKKEALVELRAKVNQIEALQILMAGVAAGLPK